MVVDFILFIGIQWVVLLGSQQVFLLQLEAIMMYQQDVQWPLSFLGINLIFILIRDISYINDFMLNILFCIEF